MAERRIDLPGTVADYLVENPLTSRRELADIFKVSYSTICLLVKSDAFSALLQERKADMVSAAMGPVYDRAAIVYEQALECLSETLQRSADPEFILRTVALLGMSVNGPSGQPVQASGPAAQVTINVEGAVIERARERLLKAPPRALEHKPATTPALTAPTEQAPAEVKTDVLAAFG